MRFSESDDCRRFAHRRCPAQYSPVLRHYSALFFTLIIAEQEKTSNTFDALLISPLLPKVFRIDSRAVALLKYAETFLT